MGFATLHITHTGVSSNSVLCWMGKMNADLGRLDHG